MEDIENQINNLIIKKFLNPPEIYICGYRNINLNKYNKYKINKFCFRCTKLNRRKIYPLLSNRFFDDFKFIFLTVSMEILKYFSNFNFNVEETKNYLVNTRGYTISNKLIMNFYTKIRKKYLSILSNWIWNITNKGKKWYKYYSLDKSQFSHDVEEYKLCIFGLNDTNTKDFRVVISKNRDGNVLKIFVKNGYKKEIIS